jgi:RNA polymerase sigma factor for flagellar operon FliA
MMMSAASASAPPRHAPGAALLSWDEYDRFLPFVRRTAIRLARRVPCDVSVSDLEGSGFVGLIDALSRSNPDAPAAERDAYLVYRIRGAMLDYASSLDARTQAAWAESRRLVRAIAALDRSLGREPEEAEIAEAMGLDGEAYRRLLTTIDALGLCRIEILDIDPAADDDGAPDTDCPPLDEQLAAAIAGLPQQLQLILALHHHEQCSAAEIAAVLDLDEPRVVELYAETIHRLRARIGRRAP